MTRPAKTGTVKSAGSFKKKVRPQQERPCPTCYAKMVWSHPDIWSCPKHGEPTRP